MNSAAPASPTSLFEAMASLILANGWAKAQQLEAVRNALSGNGRGNVSTDRRALCRMLIERRVLTSDQAAELDALIDQQPNFPHYQLLRKLGAGGMGTVFLARELSSGRELALKTILARLKEDADFVGRFHRESKVLVGLRHQHIAEVIDSGESNGVCYMAMEYINGPSVATLLRDHKALPENYVLRLCCQVAEGLAYVYDKGEIVHRDIKPENILIARSAETTESFPVDDVAKLIDFGLVKPVDDDQHLTQTGMTIGTPLYMSPEQIRGEQIDCRSDIYGLGATMFHLLTGATPFTGTSPGAIMSAHLTQPVPDPGERVPGLQSKTRELVMMAMAKKPEHRFLTFEGFIKAINDALETLGEKQSSAPRLLRKPLVLKGPLKRTAAGEAKSAGNEPLTTHMAAATGQTHAEATGRIANKFRQAQAQAQQGLSPSQTPSHAVSVPSLAATPPKPAPIATATAADELRAANTSKMFKRKPGPEAPPPQTPTGKPASTHPAPPVDGQLNSAVFKEDPTDQLGTGIIPWIALGAALAALAAWYFLH